MEEYWKSGRLSKRRCTRVMFTAKKYTMMITSEWKEDSRSLLVRMETRN